MNFANFIKWSRLFQETPKKFSFLSFCVPKNVVVYLLGKYLKSAQRNYHLSKPVALWVPRGANRSDWQACRKKGCKILLSFQSNFWVKPLNSPRLSVRASLLGEFNWPFVFVTLGRRLDLQNDFKLAFVVAVILLMVLRVFSCKCFIFNIGVSQVSVINLIFLLILMIYLLNGVVAFC